MNNPVARIMDVNLNRAGEALRSMEEFARLVMNSPALSSRVKHIRHDLGKTAEAWRRSHDAADQPLFNRDIAGDVGAAIKTEAEGKRADPLAVAAAASRRAAEALRSLSEYGKIDNPELAAEFERLRYRVYDVEPVLLADATLRRRLAAARKCAVVGRPDAIREALAGGAELIRLSGDSLRDGDFYRMSQDAAELCREAGAIFIAGNRPHIASLVDAAGVLLEPDDLPVAPARRIIGPAKLIGRPAPNREAAEAALAEGADYIEVGPDAPEWASGWDRLPHFTIGGAP